MRPRAVDRLMSGERHSHRIEAHEMVMLGPINDKPGFKAGGGRGPLDRQKRRLTPIAGTLSAGPVARRHS